MGPDSGCNRADSRLPSPRRGPSEPGGAGLRAQLAHPLLSRTRTKARQGLCWVSRIADMPRKKRRNYPGHDDPSGVVLGYDGAARRYITLGPPSEAAHEQAALLLDDIRRKEQGLGRTADASIVDRVATMMGQEATMKSGDPVEHYPVKSRERAGSTEPWRPDIDAAQDESDDTVTPIDIPSVPSGTERRLRTG